MWVKSDYKVWHFRHVTANPECWLSRPGLKAECFRRYGQEPDYWRDRWLATAMPNRLKTAPGGHRYVLAEGGEKRLEFWSSPLDSERFRDCCKETKHVVFIFRALEKHVWCGTSFGDMSSGFDLRLFIELPSSRFDFVYRVESGATLDLVFHAGDGCLYRAVADPCNLLVNGVLRNVREVELFEVSNLSDVLDTGVGPPLLVSEATSTTREARVVSPEAAAEAERRALIRQQQEELKRRERDRLEKAEREEKRMRRNEDVERERERWREMEADRKERKRMYMEMEAERKERNRMYMEMEAERKERERMYVEERRQRAHKLALDAEARERERQEQAAKNATDWVIGEQRTRPLRSRERLAAEVKRIQEAEQGERLPDALSAYLSSERALRLQIRCPQNRIPKDVRRQGNGRDGSTYFVPSLSWLWVHCHRVRGTKQPLVHPASDMASRILSMLETLVRPAEGS